MTELDELQAIRVLLSRILALMVVEYNRPDTKQRVEKEISKPTVT